MYVTTIFRRTMAQRTQVHGAGSFSKSRQLRSYSRLIQRFIEPEGSLSCSQDPSIDASPGHSGPDHTTPSCLFLRSILILSSPTTRPSTWCICFCLAHQYTICIHFFIHACYMPCSSPLWLDHSNYKQTPRPLAPKRTIQTERPPLVPKGGATFAGRRVL